ncbi:hypothetical protein HFO24_05035 [Rhizobium laguerreae]|uniref:hypothetical protein n=1 Tax=Rhizobium laguerreae TaxID=1076926 RepID=UPI001C907D5B|nr:hypothetical protein [Rhizobium laguerreae]MBY3181036.1 hypothetical protein [Rhizobium laguerreae]
MSLADLSTTIARLSPKIKTPLQLTGLIVAGVLYYLGSVSDNLLVQISGGLIGISVIVFGLSLNVLELIPRNRRASFIFMLYAAFGVIIVIFLIVGVYFLIVSGEVGNRAVAAEITGNLLAIQRQERQKLDENLRSKHDIQAKIEKAQLQGPDLIAQLQDRSNGIDSTIEVRQNRLQQIDAALLDLNAPSSKLVDAIQSARKLSYSGLDPPSEMFREPSELEPDLNRLKAALEFQITEGEKQVVRNKIYLAWLRWITGELTMEEALVEAKVIVASHPTRAEPLEFLAEFYFDAGDFSSARITCELWVSQLKRNLPVDQMKLAFSLKELANATRLANGGVSGEDYIQQAEIVYNAAQMKDPVIFALIENDHGGFFLARKDYDGAEALFSKALAYYESPSSSGIGYSFVLHNLGKVNILKYNYKIALVFIEKSIALQEITSGLGTATHVATLQLKGDALRGSGQYKDAKNSYEQAKFIIESRKVRIDLLQYVSHAISETGTLAISTGGM